ncbi:MAG: anaerobic sulfatase-maturation protein [Ignavibacteriaceae bacterium]
MNEIMISDAFHIMAKPTGPICNLDCTYCFYLEKENIYPNNKNWKMPDDVLEKFIKEYIKIQKTEEINFAWQGGEPTLLGVNYFKNVVELQTKYSNGKKINNAFQTNGVLLDDEWCEFFVRNNFLIGLSIDGPKESHDKYRVYKGGQATFEKVMRGISYLKKHNVEFNTLTCVNRTNSYKPLEVYHFLKEIGSGFMQFIPIVERKLNGEGELLILVSPDSKRDAEVTEWSVEPLQYGIFLATIFDEWVRNDVGKYFVQMFDVALESWLGVPQSLCVFNETCGSALAIEHNGDIFSCNHYVYPENKLGNIIENPIESIINDSKQVKFGNDKKDRLPKYCINCEVRFACNGECPKHRFIKTPDGEDGLNYLCAGYKYFFNHIDAYMKFMANELINQRAPANVISWAAEKDKGFSSLKVNRNDPCPWGSGKKFKKCCMMD